MSTATESLTDRDHRIDSVIYEPSALDRGEPPDPAEWVTRHPELASDLEEHFRDLNALGLLETQSETTSCSKGWARAARGWSSVPGTGSTGTSSP